MASTYAFLHQRLAVRSASARLAAHSAGCKPRCPWPELARRVRGEMDHEAVRINTARAAALVHLAGGIGGLELDAHITPS